MRMTGNVRFGAEFMFVSCCPTPNHHGVSDLLPTDRNCDFDNLAFQVSANSLESGKPINQSFLASQTRQREPSALR